MSRDQNQRASSERVSPKPAARQRLLASLLFLATFFTATTLGSVWWVGSRTELSTTLSLWLAPQTISTVWTDSTYLLNGLAFSIPLLTILLSHELGHYVLCRRYGLPSTPPYFLPAPFALGTLGAFIRIKAPIRDKRQLLDIGAGGPIAGFVVLLPFLVFGIAHSQITVLVPADPEIANAVLLRPGHSLLIEALTRLFHGSLEQNEILNLHPFALAAWFGLLATSLNLLPMGQLDGGHIAYAALGARRQLWLAAPAWLALAACGFAWTGWFLWCVVVVILRLRHPPVLDETTELDSRRRTVALIAAILFLVSFMPVPISTVAVVS
jgi:membrane-associated protease RseP (regulator of RpoE activity)